MEPISSLSRRPCTQKSRLEPYVLNSHSPPPSKPIDLHIIYRPQTNYASAEPSTNVSNVKVLPKGTRIVLGKQKGKQFTIPKANSFKIPNSGISSAIGKARLTADYFYTHLPKLKSGSRGLRLEVLHSVKSQHPEIHNIRESRWETHYGNDGANNPQIPYGFPEERTTKGNNHLKLLRRNAWKKNFCTPQPPQTAQVKSRAEAVEPIIRLSTPQAKNTRRPDSRYNKETLFCGLDNGRDKSPDYMVPVLPMRLSENISKQHILPGCWK